MNIYLLIALGGALGSVTRHWLANVVSEPISQHFPWGTFWVNVSGCLAIGFFGSLNLPSWRYFSSTDARLFLMTGICGGYTTFSAFGLQTYGLLRAGDWTRAGAYVVSSVVVCVLSVWLGHLLASPFGPPR
ncbi:MAG: fluoride efflux transporter CrcB [Pseudomonadota bacterium]